MSVKSVPWLELISLFQTKQLIDLELLQMSLQSGTIGPSLTEKIVNWSSASASSLMLLLSTSTFVWQLSAFCWSRMLPDFERGPDLIDRKRRQSWTGQNGGGWGGVKYPHLFKPIFYFCTASFRLRFEPLITTEQRTYPPSNFYTRQPKFDKVWTRIPPFSDPLCASATELAPEMAESFSGVNCVFASIRWCQIKREKTLRGSNWHSTTWSPSRVEHATNVVAKVL